jgi:hypothetical protein
VRVVTLGYLRDTPTERLREHVESRITALIKPRLLCEPMPEASTNDWLVLAALVVRLHEQKATNE